MALTSVMGFYYRIGSDDYPANMSPDSKFGFDQVAAGVTSSPIFRYSVNDCEKALTVCRSLQQRAFYDSTNTNVILAENVEKTLDTENVSSVGWQMAFKAAEFISNNQATINNNPTTDGGYLNWGDENLETEVESYVKGSLAILQSSHQNRIQYARFSITFAPGQVVTFQIFYDADAFVERSDNISYRVYRYVDLTGDDQISAEEFKTQIVSKLFDIVSGGKYKTWSMLTIDKRLSDTETIEEPFYVFSSIAREISEDIMKLQIKAYLMGIYDDMTYLRYTYPTLFSENEIRIIPMYDNTLETITGTSTVVHPLSILNLASTLTTFGFNISKSSTDYRPCEIFRVGPGAGWVAGNTFKFNFPILAVEVDTASGIILPISKRFPAYKPIYGENISGEAAEFHYMLISILGYLMGDNRKLSDEFISQYSINEETDSTTGRKKIIATFSGNLWTIYGPITNGVSV